jgi:hypothetical protein
MRFISSLASGPPGQEKTRGIRLRVGEPEIACLKRVLAFVPSSSHSHAARDEEVSELLADRLKREGLLDSAPPVLPELQSKLVILK